MGKHIGDCLEFQIRFEAGSDFQYDHAKSIFEGMGIALAGHLNETHKGNKVITEIGILENGSVDRELKKIKAEAIEANK